MSVEATLSRLKLGTTELLPEAELKQKLERSTKTGRPLRIKLGIDPSAPHLTLGHAVVLRKLRQFQDEGHIAVLLVGDFTRLVGDPSDQSSTRPLVTKEIIEANMRTYQEQAYKILDPDKTELRYNSEWLSKLGVEGMIELTSKYTVARMLERDDFKKRFRAESAISVLEFLYPLLQAYDSVALKADVEIGGHDQLFNLLAGRTIQEQYGQEAQVVLTVPLLIGTDGVKSMGQSKNNYIGISEAPQEIFGKIMSLPDELMEQYYTLLTDVAWSDVKDLHPKTCKQQLGRLMVSWFYGNTEAQSAQDQFDQVYARKELPDDIPQIVLSADQLEGGAIWIVALLDQAKLVNTRSDGRRLVQQGGVQINGEKVSDVNCKVTPVEGMVIKAGKHKFAKVKLEAQS